jgi:hypothetical protein
MAALAATEAPARRRITPPSCRFIAEALFVHGMVARAMGARKLAAALRLSLRRRER